MGRHTGSMAWHSGTTRGFAYRRAAVAVLSAVAVAVIALLLAPAGDVRSSAVAAGNGLATTTTGSSDPIGSSAPETSSGSPSGSGTGSATESTSPTVETTSPPPSPSETDVSTAPSSSDLPSSPAELPTSPSPFTELPSTVLTPPVEPTLLLVSSEPPVTTLPALPTPAELSTSPSPVLSELLPRISTGRPASTAPRTVDQDPGQSASQEPIVLVEGVKSSAIGSGAGLGLPTVVPPTVAPPSPTTPDVSQATASGIPAETDQAEATDPSLALADPYPEDRRIRFRLAADAGTAVFLFLGFVFLGMGAGWTMAHLRSAGSHRRH